ncbi:MAG: AI-2E family transporter, partial [bacterium]|nr:AI-2E family transporter [bacterium]
MDDGARNLHLIKLFTGFITTVLLVVILMELRNIFLPLCMALLLYFLFNGVVKKMLKLRIPKVIVLAFLLVFIFILFYFLGTLIASSASSFAQKFSGYWRDVTDMANKLLDKLELTDNVKSYFSNKDWLKSIDTSSVTDVISGTFGSFAAFVGNLVLVLVFLMFMLAGRDSLKGRVDKAFENDRADRFRA